MKRVLVTGLSGVGKSTLLERLRRRGFRCVDTDFDGYCGPPDGSPPPTPHSQPGWIWRPERVEALLAEESGEVLVVSGCVDNQGEFYSWFDHVVLLTAPVAVMAERLATRGREGYGGNPRQRAEALGYVDSVLPLLRHGATLEVDTAAPPEVVEAVVLAHLGAD